MILWDLSGLATEWGILTWGVMSGHLIHHGDDDDDDDDDDDG